MNFGRKQEGFLYKYKEKGDFSRREVSFRLK